MTEQIRVLIADDEPALRGALADLLEHEDDLTLIGTAGDADEAIALANDERPDVALVDVSMPAGGGARAAHLGDRPCRWHLQLRLRTAGLVLGACPARR